jgi:hypothetical protein
MCPSRVIPVLGRPWEESALDHDIASAWREAGEVLGVRVRAPHTYVLPNGVPIELEAYLEDFGSKAGILLVALQDEERCAALRGSGAYHSELAPSYRSFDDAHFKATLDDWQWFGPDDRRPAWYTGKPWS